MNPARVACVVFFTDARKAVRIQCYTHVGVGQNEIIVYHAMEEFHQPLNCYVDFTKCCSPAFLGVKNQNKKQSTVNFIELLSREFC